jgi:hypothetical protein
MIRWVAIPLPGSVASRDMMALKRSSESGAEQICGLGMAGSRYRRIAPIETATACSKCVDSVYSDYADLQRAS